MKNNRILFVHLGQSIPNYVIANVRRTAEIFPNSEVLLITDSDQSISKNIKSVKYLRSMETRDAFRMSKLDTTFRSGFWVKSIERIIAVLEYQIDHDLIDVIHLESDILLMPNAPIDSICHLNMATWTSYSENKSVGALIYVPNANHAERMLDAIFEILKIRPDITDMTLLHLLCTEYQLGNFFSHAALRINGEERKSRQVNFLDQGIFDPAQIGMWLTGEDPRNHFGMEVLHLNELYEKGDSNINPSELTYKVDEDGNLSATNRFGVRIEIWSLHVHSKNTAIFEDKYSQLLKNYVELSKNKEVIRKMHPAKALKLIIDNIQKKTFLAYTKNIFFYFKNLSKNGRL